jgi:hypothetical protein
MVNGTCQSQELRSFSSSKHSINWRRIGVMHFGRLPMLRPADFLCSLRRPTKIPPFTSVEDRQTTPARQTTVDHRSDRLQLSFPVRRRLMSLDYVLLIDDAQEDSVF